MIKSQRRVIIRGLANNRLVSQVTQRRADLCQHLQSVPSLGALSQVRTCYLPVLPRPLPARQQPLLPCPARFARSLQPLPCALHSPTATHPNLSHNRQHHSRPISIQKPLPAASRGGWPCHSFRATHTRHLPWRSHSLPKTSRTR